MTLVTGISANTAAMAMEAMKHGRRLSVKDQAADIKADADRNARRVENAGDIEESDLLIPAPAVSIDVLTSGQRQRNGTTYREAASAYRDMDF